MSSVEDTPVVSSPTPATSLHRLPFRYRPFTSENTIIGQLYAARHNTQKPSRAKYTGVDARTLYDLDCEIKSHHVEKIRKHMAPEWDQVVEEILQVDTKWGRRKVAVDLIEWKTETQNKSRERVARSRSQEKGKQLGECEQRDGKRTPEMACTQSRERAHRSVDPRQSKHIERGQTGGDPERDCDPETGMEAHRVYERWRLL